MTPRHLERGRLREGELRGLVAERERTALASGALKPIATEAVTVADGGVPFSLRLASGLERKRASSTAGGEDPFLPYDERLFVAHVSETHVALLNRFPVLSGHVLLVTRRFEQQHAPLDPADFHALALGLAELDGLAFYNSGPEAGASQAHKHLQLVPTPLGDGPERTPLDRVLPPHPRGSVAELPFGHAFAPLDPPAVSPAALADQLREAHGQLSRALDLERRPRPFNLLATRAWVLVVPRSRECWESISVNALGFAGSLLVRDRLELERLTAKRPLSVLADVAEPRRPRG